MNKVIIICIMSLLILSLFNYKERLENINNSNLSKLQNNSTTKIQSSFCPEWVREVKTDNLKIYITEKMDDRCYFDYSIIRIYKDNNFIIKYTDYSKLYADFPRHTEKYPITVDNDFTLNWEWEFNSFPPNYDVTGDGSPNLVINTWSGGAHCCYSYLIFDVGKNPRLITELELGHSSSSKIYKNIQQPGLVIEANDWNYAYWNASFAGSPAPLIYLNYDIKTNQYVLNTEMMRQPIPDKKILDKWKVEVRENWNKWPANLWQYMLHLIYKGNWQAALNFMDSAWPKGEYLYLNNEKYNKRRFLKTLITRIKESKYATDIQKLNNNNF
ncbi:MAG: hypothetical protein CMJ11_06240 [Pelagibacterales bacterium]|nr:hypothetical protein [Pelagibacterales bacterium]